MSFFKTWNHIRSEQKYLIIIISAAVIFRVAAAIYLGDVVMNMPGTYDQISYHNLAIRVLNGHGFTFGTTWWPATLANEPTAHWSYIYTFYLVGVYRIFGVHPIVARILQALIVGILHPWLVFNIGKKVFNPRVGLIAASLTAIYAYFIYYSATLMTEPFYITAILASIYFAIVSERQCFWRIINKEKIEAKCWFYTLAIGFSLGAAILLRQLFLILAVFLFIWLILVAKKESPDQ